MREAAHLTDAEWKIIELLWQSSPQTLMQLTRALDAETGWTKHTVIALLKRMLGKNTVRVEDNGRTKFFYANIDREAIEREQTDSFMNRVFGGKASLLVNNMVESGQLSVAELDELSALIAQARRKQEAP